MLFKRKRKEPSHKMSLKLIGKGYILYNPTPGSSRDDTITETGKLLAIRGWEKVRKDTQVDHTGMQGRKKLF